MMDNFKLEPLPDVERLSKCVTRVLGQNPGKFTLQGTNTYLLGAHPPYILVDTSDGNEAYTSVLRDALAELSARRDSTSMPKTTSNTTSTSALVSDIIITHAHPDHYGGLRNVLVLLREFPIRDEGEIEEAFVPPRIHKALPNYVPAPLQELLDTLPPDLYSAPSPAPAGTAKEVFHSLTPHPPLHAPGVTLHVVPTPGHTPDSVSLVLVPDESNSDSMSSPNDGTGEEKDGETETEIELPSIFTADTILGQGTAVFEDLAAYMESLEHVHAICSGSPIGGVVRSSESGGTEPRNSREGQSQLPRLANPPRLLPGHGPIIPSSESIAYVEGYIEHRRAREREILGVLDTPNPSRSHSGGPNANVYVWSIEAIVKTVYASAPENLWMAAARGVWLHLRKCEGEGVVRRVRIGGGDGVVRADEYGEGIGGEAEISQRRSEADRMGEEVWRSRWILVRRDGEDGGVDEAAAAGRL